MDIYGIISIVIIVVFVIPGAVIGWMMAHAVDGYEDERGFHEGRPQ